jgi:deoxyribodipyrimidine photo-lyase
MIGKHPQAPSISDDRAVLPFTGGENEASKRLQHYFWETENISTYKETRNGLLGADYSSKFSPWLANGSLSPRTIYWELKQFEREITSNQSTYWLFFELLWRDFFRYVSLKFGRRLFLKNGLKDEERRFYFNKNKFEHWRTGNTGKPFVDANMRELLHSGYMSNRGRQNVASYLVHDMGLDWRAGAAWFESQLIDYDPCSNYGNWLYVSGLGNDPRPNRKFNVQRQANMYDPEGKYVETWLNE